MISDWFTKELVKKTEVVSLDLILSRALIVSGYYFQSHSVVVNVKHLD